MKKQSKAAHIKIRRGTASQFFRDVSKKGYSDGGYTAQQRDRVASDSD